MKKAFTAILAAAIVLTLCACGNKGAGDTAQTAAPAGTPSGQTSAPVMEQDIVPSANPAPTPETPTGAFSDTVEGTVSDAVAELEAEFNTLKGEIDTFDKYQENVEQIEAFYARACRETEELGIGMREYALNYAQSVTASDKPGDEKFDDLETIYDTIYDDAGDDIYDIYDHLLDDAYDVFYDGILDDAYDTAPFKAWSRARSDEYERWSDARSDVYEAWSDYRSDVYDFYSDLRSALWDNDTEKAEKVIGRFAEDIAELKAKAQAD